MSNETAENKKPRQRWSQDEVAALTEAVTLCGYRFPLISSLYGPGGLNRLSEYRCSTPSALIDKCRNEHERLKRLGEPLEPFVFVVSERTPWVPPTDWTPPPGWTAPHGTISKRVEIDSVPIVETVPSVPIVEPICNTSDTFANSTNGTGNAFTIECILARLNSIENLISVLSAKVNDGESMVPTQRIFWTPENDALLLIEHEKVVKGITSYKKIAATGMFGVCKGGSLKNRVNKLKYKDSVKESVKEKK